MAASVSILAGCYTDRAGTPGGIDLDIHGRVKGQTGYVDDRIVFTRADTAVTDVGDTPDGVARYRAELELTPSYRFDDTRAGASLRLFSSLNSAYDHGRATSEFDDEPFNYDRFRREEALDIDRAYLFLDSRFGRLEAGWVNGVGDQLAVTGPFDWGIGGADGDYAYFVDLPIDIGFMALRPFVSANPSPRVNYVTPRMAGLRAGFGYQRDTRNSGFEFEYGSEARGVIGRNALPSSTSEAVAAGFRDVWEVSVDFERDFGSLNVALGAAYIGGKAIDSPTGARFHDLSSLQVGTRLGYHGFELGGGYVWAGDSGYNLAVDLEPSSQRDNQHSYHVSARYRFDDLTIGASFLYGDDAGDPTVPASRQLWVYSLGATYRLEDRWAVSGEYGYLRPLSADFPDFRVHLVVLEVAYVF